MLGLIKKDFLLIKAISKPIIIVFIIYLILAFQGRFDVTFVIPLIGVVLFISTFSYDDFNNWNSYAVTLPDGRENVVKAKYIFSIILTVVLGIVSLAISILIGYTRANSINLDEIISSLMGTLLSSTIIISLFCPIIFKFGAKNGRIILFVIAFGIDGIIRVISNSVDMTSAINMVNGLEDYSYMVISVIPVILLGVSYLISNKIYQNKEF